MTHLSALLVLLVVLRLVPEATAASSLRRERQVSRLLQEKTETLADKAKEVGQKVKDEAATAGEALKQKLPGGDDDDDGEKPEALENVKDKAAAGGEAVKNKLNGGTQLRGEWGDSIEKALVEGSSDDIEQTLLEGSSDDGDDGVNLQLRGSRYTGRHHGRYGGCYHCGGGYAYPDSGYGYGYGHYGHYGRPHKRSYTYKYGHGGWR